MKHDVVRWLGAIGKNAVICGALVGGLVTSTGCGAIKAAANPKVAWALNDPAPMSVVVRRADMAEKTAENVDRLMTDTPADESSPWLAKVGPEKDAATAQMVELRKHDLYVTGVRIVAAEVWAKSLADLEKKPAAGAPATAPVAAAAPREEAAQEPVAKDAKRGKKKGKKAKNAKSEDNEAIAPTPTPAPAAPAAPGADPAATAAKYPSLLAAIDKDLGDAWSKVMEKKKAMGERKAQIAVLEAANDEKGIADADKKANKAKIADLEKQIDALEDEAKRLEKEFVPKAKASAQKTPQAVREKVGPALVNLRQAVDDANVANGAAAVRYPLAATTIVDSAQQMALVYVGDVIEEKTGKRPSTQGIQPAVTMEGGKVTVTINGLEGKDVGKISAGELASEVGARTTRWVKRAVGLMGVISANRDILEFEDDVLGALLDGFKAAGYAAPAAATIPEPPPAAPQQGAAPRS